MKTYFSFQNVPGIGLVLMFLFTSCQTDEFTEPAVVIEEPTTTETVEETDPTLRINNSLVFPKTAQVYGKSIEYWATEFGRKIYTYDCEEVLLSKMVSLSDNVVAPFSLTSETTPEEYTINKDQYVLLSPILVVNDYPCPAEFEFEPAEGQSLEDFLKETAKPYIDPLETVEVFVDGNEIDEVLKYRLSSGLFTFTGNPDLAGCFDPCVTGQPQEAVIDGYFLMLKKLKIGKHTILIRGEAPSQNFTFEWNLIFNVVK
ncbi:hypothetical protein [Cognataquiflexum aquatile]|uniref:hypothetical protein n=1 Tax=Cognataquiflexum aquatile TaxID=2249427 RepID=UPI000DEBCEB2|nr:hypothetical protein [Cognataquiflexum aquatile]